MKLKTKLILKIMKNVILSNGKLRAFYLKFQTLLIPDTFAEIDIYILCLLSDALRN